jgi:hypothetical protein
MAKIYNSKLTKELIEGAKIQSSVDKVPTELMEKVQPVMETNPKSLAVCDVSAYNVALNATSATVYTTPSDRDFYLNSVTLSMIKDASSASTSSFVTSTINGATVNLLRLSCFASTAQTGQISTSYPKPLKLDRGVSIIVGNTSATANVRSDCCLTGWVDETSKA